MNQHINVPMTKKEAASLKAGDYVYFTGTICAARSAAHKRMDEALGRREALPLDVEGSIIYYMGSSPVKEEGPVSSAGPITVNRMDKHTPRLLDLGMGTMIGKGKRNRDVVDATVRGGAVYFAAVGGAGTTLPKCALSSEIVAYEDLGTEAVRKLTIQDFPVAMVMDTPGNNLCETVVKEFCTLQQGDVKRIIYMVLMNLPHAPMWLFTIARMAREEDTRTAAEKCGYISEMVKRTDRRRRVTVVATGIEYIPSEDGFILFLDHQGLLNIFALFSTCPRPLSVVIEKETSNQILIKQVLGAIESLAVNRDDIKDQVRIITEATKLVRSGHNFVIFTEDYRGRNRNEILDFKSGTFKNAVRAGCPIVPMAPINPFRPFNTNSLKREEVQVHYMKPILPGRYMGMETSEIAYLVHDRIREEVNKGPTQNGLTS